MPDDDLDKLKRDAEAATQESWSWDAGDIGIDFSVPYCGVSTVDGDLQIAEVNDLFDQKEGRANATHIANMDPPTTKRLLARLERAEAALRALEKAEALYRNRYEVHGGGSLHAGIAWDSMRKAGDVARTALAEEPADD